MRRLCPALLLLVALIHFLPVSGVFGATSLQRLYGVTIDDPNLLVLMQHRAVLFAIVGGVLVAATIKRAWRPLAILIGLLSVGSFLLIAWSVGGYNAMIARVVWIDVAALGMLTLAGLLDAHESRPRAPV